MGKTITDECVCCGRPCLGDGCPNRNVERYFCDDCQKEYEPEELYVYEDEWLCEECLIDRFKTVAQEER